jgi:hypothetical protein
MLTLIVDEGRKAPACVSECRQVGRENKMEESYGTVIKP